jgi:hypothetical protein
MNLTREKIEENQNDLLEKNNRIYLLPNTTLWTPITCLLINFPHLPISEHHITCDPKTPSQSPNTKKINYQIGDLIIGNLMHNNYQQWKNLSSSLSCTKRLFNYLVIYSLTGFTYSSTLATLTHICQLIN